MIRIPDENEPDPTLSEIVEWEWKQFGRATRQTLSRAAVNVVVEALVQQLEAAGEDAAAEMVADWAEPWPE